MVSKNIYKNRIEWVDSAKGIGILLVLFGHTSLPNSIVQFIYSFHMPLFFFLSGMFFNSNSFNLFFRRRIDRLVIPYFIFGIFSIFIWIGREYYIYGYFKTSALQYIFGLLYGSSKYLTFNSPLWFLTCLFTVSIYMYLILKIKSKSIRLFIIIFLLLIGYMYSIFLVPHFRLPWMIDTALVAVFFVFLGKLIGVFLHKNLNKFPLLFLSLFFFSITQFLSIVNGRVDMQGMVFHNLILFILAANSGIFLVVFISKILPNNKILQYLGENSLIIFALHVPIFSIITGISKIMFNYPICMGSYDALIKISPEANPYFISLIYVVPTLLILIPVIELINRKFPFIIGLKRNV